MIGMRPWNTWMINKLRSYYMMTIQMMEMMLMILRISRMKKAVMTLKILMKKIRIKRNPKMTKSNQKLLRIKMLIRKYLS